MRVVLQDGRRVNGRNDENVSNQSDYTIHCFKIFPTNSQPLRKTIGVDPVVIEGSGPSQNCIARFHDVLDPLFELSKNMKKKY